MFFKNKNGYVGYGKRCSEPMKISIITATFNSASTIRATLESVKQQDYLNIEHIIIDGASTDNTLEIVKEYPSVSRIFSEPDKGIYDAGY